jgi:hypothetical protein
VCSSGKLTLAFLVRYRIRIRILNERQPNPKSGWRCKNCWKFVCCDIIAASCVADPTIIFYMYSRFEFGSSKLKIRIPNFLSYRYRLLTIPDKNVRSGTKKTGLYQCKPVVCLMDTVSRDFRLCFFH